MKARSILLILPCLVFLSAEASCATYSYEDANGALVFTDDPTKLPSQKKVTTLPDLPLEPQPLRQAGGRARPSATPLAPARPEEPTVHRQNAFYDVGGRTFLDIRREIYRRSPLRRKDGVAVAWCRWGVRWEIHTRRNGNLCEIAAVETEVEVSITMPRWTNYPSAGDGMKAAWDTYYASVLEHEETHGSHGIAAAAEIQRRLPEQVRSLTCKAAKEEGDLLAQRIIAEYREKDAEFDRVSLNAEMITDVQMAADEREGVRGRQYDTGKRAQSR